jgi:hypothetical protein
VEFEWPFPTFLSENTLIPDLALIGSTAAKEISTSFCQAKTVYYRMRPFSILWKKERMIDCGNYE